MLHSKQITTSFYLSVQEKKKARAIAEGDRQGVIDAEYNIQEFTKNIKSRNGFSSKGCLNKNH